MQNGKKTRKKQTKLSNKLLPVHKLPKQSKKLKKCNCRKRNQNLKFKLFKQFLNLQ